MNAKNSLEVAISFWVGNEQSTSLSEGGLGIPPIVLNIHLSSKVLWLVSYEQVKESSSHLQRAMGEPDLSSHHHHHQHHQSCEVLTAYTADAGDKTSQSLTSPPTTFTITTSSPRAKAKILHHQHLLQHHLLHHHHNHCHHHHHQLEASVYKSCSHSCNKGEFILIYLFWIVASGEWTPLINDTLRPRGQNWVNWHHSHP